MNLDTLKTDLDTAISLATNIKDLVPYIEIQPPEVLSTTWETGDVETNQRMEIPKRITAGHAVGFPWHENAIGRLTTPNYGTYKVSLREDIGATATDYSTTEITGIRRSSYQTHSGLLFGIFNDPIGEIWYMPEPYGAVTKVAEMVCGYAHPFSWTHDPSTSDVWVTEYGSVTADDNPRRVFHSANGGVTWTSTELDAFGEFDHIHTPCYHPPTGNLYVATGDNTGKHVYKSTDRGQTFAKITTPSAIGRKLTAYAIRDDGIIVWGNDETPTGLYLHDTTTDEFTLVRIHTDGFRGYPATLTWTPDSTLLIPTRQDGYNAPGIFATKDFSNFHRILDNSQDGDYDQRGIESIEGPDDKNRFYCRGLGTGPALHPVIKPPAVYNAGEVNTTLTDATATINLVENLTIIDCIVPTWESPPAEPTELFSLAYTGGYISCTLLADGKVSLTDGTATDTTGITGDTGDLLIKWDGKYDAGVQFPFMLEIKANEVTLKVLNRVTHEWATATVSISIPAGSATLTAKANTKHQVKTVSVVNEDSWKTLRQAGLAVY